MAHQSAAPAPTFATPDLFSATLPALPRLTPATPWRRYHYDSLATCAAQVNPEPPADAWSRRGWAAGNAQFYGVELPDALDMARDGWTDGAARAIAAHEGLAAVAPAVPRLARYDVAGAVPNVARALSGNPLAMRRVAVRETARFPILTLVCDVIQNCELCSGDFVNNAIAQAAVVDLLEDRGYRCNVLALARLVNAGSLGAEICTQVKAPEQPLSLAHAVFALGHPGYVRRLLVCVLSADQQNAPLGYAFGRAQEATPDADRPDLFILPGPVYGQSAADRFTMILRALRGQKCPGIPDENT